MVRRENKFRMFFLFLVFKVLEHLRYQLSSAFRDLLKTMFISPLLVMLVSVTLGTGVCQSDSVRILLMKKQKRKRKKKIKRKISRFSYYKSL